MNYNEENRTPRDRLCGDMFFREFGVENKDCKENRSVYDTRPTCSTAKYSEKCADRHWERKSCSTRKIPAPSIAMAYVPMQEWENIFDCDEALVHGTLFADLVFPFYPATCNCKGRDMK